jgi:hypothetical protein
LSVENHAALKNFLQQIIKKFREKHVSLKSRHKKVPKVTSGIFLQLILYLKISSLNFNIAHLRVLAFFAKAVGCIAEQIGGEELRGGSVQGRRG